jgi:hypothetical protein
MHPEKKLKIMKKLYCFCLALMGGFFLFGQTTLELNWQITDEQGTPLVGVVVLKKGTYEGTVTDVDGHFSITVVPGKDELVVSYLGHENLNFKTYQGMQSIGKEVLLAKLYDLPEVNIVAHTYRCPFHHSETRSSLQLDSLSFPHYVRPKIRVYPIPTQHTLYLQEETALGQVDLYNLNGQKLQSFNFRDQLNAALDLGHLPAGTYLLRSDKGWVEKVILQRR